jgi:hypothetical protein
MKMNNNPQEYSKQKLKEIVDSFNVSKEMINDMKNINSDSIELIKKLEIALINLEIEAVHLNSPTINIIAKYIKDSIGNIKQQIQQQNRKQQNRLEEYDLLCDYFKQIEENIKKN